jgi:hypothetical protein
MTEPDIWGVWIEQDGTEWCVCRNNDGRRTVISRHGSEAQATAAARELNRSGPSDAPSDTAPDIAPHAE